MAVTYTEMKGRTVIITGGGGGLGRAVAQKLGENQVNVFLVDGNKELVEKAVSELKAQGIEATGFTADVRKEEAMEMMADTCLATYGRIDYLVTCAGIFKHVLLENMTFEEWKETIDVNLHGTFLAVRKTVGPMLKAGFGRIVLFSSQSAIRGGPTHVHYGASKGAIVTMTRAFMREVAPRNIRVNCVAPGLIVTPMTEDNLAAPDKLEDVKQQIPMGRTGTPGEIAKVVAFLLSEESSFMTGQTINITGGAIVNT